MLLHAATTLDDVYQTLSPEPLLTPEEVQAFYSHQLNGVRGDDHVARLALGLNRALGGSHYKALLMGHSGVDKSDQRGYRNSYGNLSITVPMIVATL